MVISITFGVLLISESDFQSPHFTVPPKLITLEIYNTVKNEVDGADLHNTKIKLNRRGIRNGAGIYA